MHYVQVCVCVLSLGQDTVVPHICIVIHRSLGNPYINHVRFNIITIVTINVPVSSSHGTIRIYHVCGS